LPTATSDSRDRPRPLASGLRHDAPVSSRARRA
jgi:hypothetical protein